MDAELGVSKKSIRRLANTPQVRLSFYTAGENFLIHKSKKALWKVSDDGKSIEPVFSSDVLDASEMEGV
jgi:hypothetical protein